MAEAINILWLKRDLRWQDHDALNAAIKADKPLVILFCFEEILRSAHDFGLRHWQAQYHSLQEMNRALASQSREILLCHAPAADQVFDYLFANYPVAAVFSHQEHGISVSYQRDQRLQKLCSAKGVQWHEFDHNGVKRGLKNRAQWDEQWREYMQKGQKIIEAEKIPFPADTQWHNLKKALEQHFALETELEAELRQWPKSFIAVGEKAAQNRLEHFLAQDIYGYQTHIGEPDLSRKYCSRLSVALAWGNLSLRQIYQAALAGYDQSRNKREHQAFISRLHWHSHFIQKFEMEDRMEEENLNRGFDRIRTESDPKLLKAWQGGQTGFPLVDASMRAVKATGYLNFRMRAMLVSFLSHLLWQPWQSGHPTLASAFLDYIPGIHIPQFQMQSGVTGINTLRIYNPLKQSLEKDPAAKFIREWLPELAALPDEIVHQPWQLSPLEEQFYNFKLDRDYPAPIIDLKKAHEKARERLWEMKKDPLVQKENGRILQRHTTANRNIDRRTRTILSTKRSSKHD